MADPPDPADPPIPARFHHFAGWFTTNVAARLGAVSSYRAVERLPPESDGVAGQAVPSRGLLRVGRYVPEVLEPMLAGRWRRPSRAEAQMLREMLATLVHESIHLAMGNRHDRDPWVTGPGQAPSRSSVVFLEEGVTEATSQRLLPAVLQGFEPWAAGIGVSPDVGDAYPNYVPATRELLASVKSLPGMEGRDVLMELAGVRPERKLDLLVEQAMDGFGLTRNVPPWQRAQVRSRIRAALEAHVERNRDWMEPKDPSRPGQLDTREPAQLSTIMGSQMDMELRRQLHVEGERAGMTLPGGWRQRLAATELGIAERMREQNAFEGPESQMAINGWIVEASTQGFGVPATGERWLRNARQRHWPRSRRRTERHQSRGLAR